MGKRPIAIAAAVPCALALAACGASKAPGVQQAPSGGPSPSQAANTTTSTTTTPAPLRHKPVVSVPKGPPPNHLVVNDLIRGTGPAVKSGQTVTVNYVGVLYKNGKEFDSSWKRGQPFTTALTSTSVISGWVQGITGMKVGGRRELIIPPSLGYGKAGSPPTIPPNSTLIFVVDLLSIS